MFDDLMKRLLGQAPAPEPQSDYRQALAALLVRCAHVDGDYTPQERQVIASVLQERYQMDAPATHTLLTDGETLEAEAGDTVRLTKAIKDGVPHEDRIAVVEALWAVVLADDSRDAEENAFLRLVVSLIGVNDRDSGLARQRVEARRA